MASSLARNWVVECQTEDLSGLVLRNAEPLRELGEGEVLVELRAASLNYRDLVLATVSPSSSDDKEVIAADVFPRVLWA